MNLFGTEYGEQRVCGMTVILFLANSSHTEKAEWVVWITDLVAVQHLFRMSFRML